MNEPQTRKHNGYQMPIQEKWDAFLAATAVSVPLLFVAFSKGSPLDSLMGWFSLGGALLFGLSAIVWLLGILFNLNDDDLFDANVVTVFVFGVIPLVLLAIGKFLGFGYSFVLLVSLYFIIWRLTRTKAEE